MDDLATLNVEYLRDRKVCVAGRLVSMTHDELAQLAIACGAEFLRSPRRTGFLLVLGDAWRDSDGKTFSQVVMRAKRLQLYGYAIDFVAEDDFLDQLGLGTSAAAIRGPHTLGDLSHILEIPLVRLRRWLRAKLIRPIATQYSIPYFDFRQVSFIKHLQELISKGASLAAIKRGIEQTKDSLPHHESLYELWANVEADGRILLRLSGQLVDQSGQQYFDFEPSNSEQTIYAEGIAASIHELCDQALAFEEAGQLREALGTYERALELQPEHPTLHFDRGNVLFQLGDIAAGITAFEQATQLDPSFAMAWHNLGCALAVQADWPRAATSLQQALQLVPTHADSHLTLAEVLRNQGKHAEARQHELEFKKYSKSECLTSKPSNVNLRLLQFDES